MRVWRAAVALVVAAAACGGDGSDAEPELRPADEVGTEAEAAAARGGVVGGEPVDAGTGRSVAVTTMAVGGVELDPWLAVGIRVENRGEDTSNPDVAIACAGGDTGGWQADSTFLLYDELPADSFDEGVVHLLLPDDGYGSPVPECEAPAVVRVTFPDPVVRPVEFPIPDDVLAELNDARYVG